MKLKHTGKERSGKENYRKGKKSGKHMENKNEI